MLISLAQLEITKNDINANLEKAELYIKEAARRGSDIIQFPEMWTTGFDFEFLRSAATEQHATIAKVAALAKQFKIWITGSMLNCNDKGLPTNCTIVFAPNGTQAAIYNKLHLFSMAKEDQHLAAGDHLTLYSLPWGIAGFSICYDIRFPELFRSYALKGAELIFCPMAFPHPRLDHWQTLARARAIENQVFMISTNQVGHAHLSSDPKTKYFGHSSIIDPWGKLVISAGEEEVLLTASINLAEVVKVREQMHVLSNRRPELYELD